MEKTILELIKNDFKIWLTQYIDIHRYEIIFTVTISGANQYGRIYAERHFKSFKAACNYFNNECIKRGAGDCVIW